MVQPCLLLTGFGPFPGAPENPSAWLVESLASSAPAARACSLHAEVLPTEWDAVSRRAPHLLETLKPRVILHFGLSERASGFRIERSAHNRIMARTDAAGALPSQNTVLSMGADRLDSPFPAAHLVQHLRQRRLAVAPSRSAGRYLCNFLYYRSLAWAGRQRTPCFPVFVHVPPERGQNGPLERSELLRGAEAALRFALAFAESDAARRVTAARPATAEGPIYDR